MTRASEERFISDTTNFNLDCSQMKFILKLNENKLVSLVGRGTEVKYR